MRKSTDSVAKQIDYGFAGDVGTTPPMDHRIDETGISTPDCFDESREGQACKWQLKFGRWRGGSGAPRAPRFFYLPGTIAPSKGGRGSMAEQLSEAAVLFADVSGSTKLYETAGDAVAHAAIEKCVNLMREKTRQRQGPRHQDHRRRGDVALSRPPTQAADAAIEMQSAISELPPVGSAQIGIRIGFNHGPVVERDGDVFGDAVNLAARLAAVATKGQIITARDTVMLMSPMLKAATRAITTIQVKGKAQEIQVYELIWQQSEDMTHARFAEVDLQAEEREAAPASSRAASHALRRSGRPSRSAAMHRPIS